MPKGRARALDRAARPIALAQPAIHRRHADDPFQHAEKNVFGDPGLVLVNVAHGAALGHDGEIDGVVTGARNLQQTEIRRRWHIRIEMMGEERVGIGERRGDPRALGALRHGDDSPAGAEPRLQIGGTVGGVVAEQNDRSDLVGILHAAKDGKRQSAGQMLLPSLRRMARSGRARKSALSAVPRPGVVSAWMKPSLTSGTVVTISR